MLKQRGTFASHWKPYPYITVYVRLYPTRTALDNMYTQPDGMAWHGMVAICSSMDMVRGWCIIYSPNVFAAHCNTRRAHRAPTTYIDIGTPKALRLAAQDKQAVSFRAFRFDISRPTTRQADGRILDVLRKSTHSKSSVLVVSVWFGYVKNGLTNYRTFRPTNCKRQSAAKPDFCVFVCVCRRQYSGRV